MILWSQMDKLLSELEAKFEITSKDMLLVYHSLDI